MIEIEKELFHPLLHSLKGNSGEGWATVRSHAPWNNDQVSHEGVRDLNPRAILFAAFPENWIEVEWLRLTLVFYMLCGRLKQQLNLLLHKASILLKALKEFVNASRVLEWKILRNKPSLPIPPA